MKYIIIPSEIIEMVPDSVLQKYSLSPRRSTDKKEVMLHLEIYNILFSTANTLDLEEPTYEFPVYDSNDTDFINLTNSKEWSNE